MIPSHRLILYFMPRSSRCTTGSISRCVLSPRKPVSTVPYRLPVIVLRSHLFYMSIAFRPPIHPYCERRFRKPAQTVYLFSYLFVLKYRILLSWDLRWTYAFGFVRFSLGPRKDAYRISRFRTGFPDFVPQNGFVD